MASIGVLNKKGRTQGKVDPSKITSNGSINHDWSGLLSDEQIEELLDVLRGYRPSLSEYQFDVFKKYADGIRVAQYKFFKKTGARTSYKNDASCLRTIKPWERNS